MAIPLCTNAGYSGKQVAAAFKDRIQPQDVLVYYGDYKASIVYYSNKLMYNLEHADKIEGDKPKAMSWSSKNVMPYMALEAVPRDRDVYLVLDERKYDEFAKDFRPDEWQLLSETPKAKVYYRPAAVEE